jgi:hypothetical protein
VREERKALALSLTLGSLRHAKPWYAIRCEWSQLSDLNRRPTVYKIDNLHLTALPPNYNNIKPFGDLFA